MPIYLIFMSRMKHAIKRDEPPPRSLSSQVEIEDFEKCTYIYIASRRGGQPERDEPGQGKLAVYSIKFPTKSTKGVKKERSKTNR